MADAYRPAREYEFSLTVRQIVAIVGGSTIVLAIAFGLGVGFGHRLATAPAATTRPSDLDHLDARAAASPSPSPSPQPLTYQQELTRNEPGRTAPPPPKREEPVETPKPSPTPVVADKPSPSPTPVAARAEEPPRVVEAVAPPRGERWTIQFGAPKQKVEAEKIVAKLTAAGLDPFIVEADIAGKGHFYRVRVGQFGSREAAERTRIQTQERTKLTGVSMPMQ